MELKIKKNECFFFLGTILLFIKTLIENSLLFNFLSEDFSDLILLFAYVFLSVNIIKNMFEIKSFRKIVLYIFLILLSIVTYYYSKYTGFFTLVLVMLSASRIELKKIVRFLFVFNTFILIMHIVSYCINIIFDFESLNIMTRVIEDESQLRHSFFFVHPNVFAIYVFWTIAMYYYLNYEKLNVVKYIITLLIALYMYIFPNSRTSVIVLCILVLVTIFEKKIFISTKVLKIIFSIILIVCTLSIFIIENPIINVIDNILSNRIALGNIVYEKYGINLLGTDIRNGTGISVVNKKIYSSVKIIDSTYYSLLLNYGILSYIMIIVLVFSLMNKDGFENWHKEKVMLLVWMIYAISETSCMSAIFAFPLFLIMNENIGEKNEKK